MIYSLVIKPLAELDAKNTANWYNAQRGGLGDEFLLALEAKVNAIQRNPQRFQVVHGGIRRALTDRFPYGIFYIIEQNTIFVLAIIHTSRNPKKWMKRKT